MISRVRSPSVKAAKPVSDEGFMELALEQAAKAVGHTRPNPAVGAVVVRDGRVLTVGHTAPAGGDHAEVAALRKLGFDAEGCTLYSTLEPCNHWGRTGPCTEAILGAGVKRVVFGATDPNPKVRGRGFKRLERGGVEVVRGVLEARCTALNECFNHSIVHRRPFTVLKAAVSLDGRIATRSGESRWITSREARREGHRLRASLDAVLVGAGTVIADDPLLTARLRGARNPVRIVLDSKLRSPLDAQLVRTAKQVPTIYATTKKAPARKRRVLERAGVTVLELPATKAGLVELPPLLDALAERELNGLLVEGGAEVHGAFLDARLVQKVVLFVAPILIGGAEAPVAFGGRGVAQLAEALELEALETAHVGRDLMVTGRVKRTRRKR